MKARLNTNKTNIDPPRNTIASTINRISKFTTKTSKILPKYPIEKNPTISVAILHLLTIRVSASKTEILRAYIHARTKKKNPIKQHITLNIWIIIRISASANANHLFYCFTKNY